MDFLLSTDTSCDMYKKDLDAARIPWVPLTYTVQGEVRDDDFNKDAEYQAFYDAIKAGTMPTTSQINSYAHGEFFKRLLSEGGGKPIVHLSLSSGLSNTVSSARVAARDVMEADKNAKIYVVDTLSATQGHRILLQEGLKLRNEGFSAESAVEVLDTVAHRIQHWFMVDDLQHLKRGGRISGASAAIGTLLNIKPVLHINGEGKLSVVKKLRGARKVMEFFLEVIGENLSEIDRGEIMIVNGDAHAYAAEFQERVLESFPTLSVKVGWVGPIIGTHTGSGMFGMAFVGKPR